MARNKSQSKSKIAAWAGFDLSTTGLALGVRSQDGEEAYAQVKMQGATTWQGQPAFDLVQTPGLILTLLDDLESRGWTLVDTACSFAVRQHDMVLSDGGGQLLIPALSWQCNAASQKCGSCGNRARRPKWDASRQLHPAQADVGPA